MTYFDSHAHYYDARFMAECEEGVEALLDSLFSSTVSGIVNVGTNPENSRTALQMAQRYPHMYAAVGIHPTDAQEIADIDGALYEIEDMLASGDKKIVAIGEIGLDYHYENTDRDKQLYVFRAQLEMAKARRIPFVVHDRDAHGDVTTVLRGYAGVPGVLHSYSGSLEMAEELLRYGFMISFSGTVTFTNARRIAAVAAAMPHDRVMIETDCPYLAPHPVRGTMNHSGNLVYTNRKLAELWNVTEEECARMTIENACRLFFPAV